MIFKSLPWHPKITSCGQLVVSLSSRGTVDLYKSQIVDLQIVQTILYTITDAVPECSGTLSLIVNRCDSNISTALQVLVK